MHVHRGEMSGLWPTGPTPVPLTMSTKCGDPQQGFPGAQSWQETFTTLGLTHPCTHTHTGRHTRVYVRRSWGLSTSLSTEKRKDVWDPAELLHGSNFEKLKALITIVLDLCEGTALSLFLNLVIFLSIAFRISFLREAEFFSNSQCELFYHH